MKSNEQENRSEIYDQTVKVLAPEINKLREFYKFQARAIQEFCEEIRKLARAQVIKEFISQTALQTLGKMIGMFAVLNALKNMKACLNNDFSLYRR